MRKTWTTALVPSIFLTTISLISCQRKQAPTDLLSDAYIRVEGDSIADFGTYRVPHGEKRTARFVIKNVGTEHLVIQHIETTCGCTTAQFRKDPIAPGDTAHITVVYDGTGLAPGTFYKEISVTSNARSGLLKLGIKGNRRP